MEIVKYLLAVLCFLYSCSNGGGQVPTEKRLSERSKEERERILINIAKKVIIAPENKDFYYDYDYIRIKEDVITVSKPPSENNCYPYKAGDKYYLVNFYDKDIKWFDFADCAISVMILDENGAAVQIASGNGWYKDICGEPLYQAEPRKPKPTMLQ